jgi:hypothetical protein
VKIGDATVHLYPRVDALWPISERDHAFHVNKAALRTIPLPPDIHLEAFGAYMNSSAIVDGIKFNFLEYLKENWFNMNHLTIQSFHDSAGALIANTTTANDPAVLKPVADGPVDDCRRADVRFVRLQLVLDFRELCTAAAATENTTLCASYYLELPQETRAVLNGANVARQLTTFMGVSDLRTLSVDDIERDILAHVFQDGPIDLAPAAFNVVNASTDETSIRIRLTQAVLRLAISTIEKGVFDSLCPNYSTKPDAAVEMISQTQTDKEGNPVTLGIAQYHSLLMAAARPFFNSKEFPLDLAKYFIDKMHPDIRRVLQETYPQINDSHDRASSAQRKSIQQILILATQAEVRVQNLQSIVKSYVGHQNFICQEASAYPSQAESTISHYQNNGQESPAKKRPPTCFG